VRSLLDVNILIALSDEAQVHFDLARRWLQDNIAHGWATCPITQNGFVRVANKRKDLHSASIPQAVRLLTDWINQSDHEFWPDDLSLLETSTIDHSSLLGQSQITDVYLLALAVKHGGRFVTLDRRVTLSAVRGARPEHLVVV
jgi:uncharacterized protein